MPGSLLNLGRNRLARHDSTRSDISTYSNDSKKRVSFNKAVRVKKYTRSEDGNDPRRSGRKFWFKVYDDDDLDADRWEEYSGDEGKSSSDDRLKTIDESSSTNPVDADSIGGSDVKKIIEKFNQQSLDREGHSGSKYDSLTKYKRNSILNGMKSFFGSTSFRNKKKNSSVQDRNLENLFRSHNDENIPNGDVTVEKAHGDLWTPKVAEKHSYSKTDLANNNSNSRDSKTVVDVEKWESGDQLVFDARQYDKSVEKTGDGELTKTIEQGDKIWKNITRTVTYAESSPKIIRKSKGRTNGIKSDGTKATVSTESTAERSRPPSKYSIKRDIAAQCTQSPDVKSKNSDRYKVIRSRNGVVSAYSNVPPLEDDTNKTSKRTSLDIERITRPTTCKRDHRHNDIKRETSALTKSKLYRSDNLRKSTGDYSPSVISKDVSHRRTESKPVSRSTADYRRGYSTLSAHRRGSRHRARSHEDRIPNISGVKILVNGESVDEGSVRGGLAAAYNARQRGRTSSASPAREFKSYRPSSDQSSEYNHETVVLYIPGVSHQEKNTDEEERISGATVTRSQSVSVKRPPRNKKYDSLRGGLHSGNFDDEDEMNHLMENKEISPTHNKQKWNEYRTLARI